MKTQKQIFRAYLKKNGFCLSSVLSTVQLVPHFYKDRDGNHNLVTNISVCIWGGSNTKPGGLGCVSFHFGGTQRRYRCRQSYQAEFFKKAFCPKTAIEAIETFESWRETSTQAIKAWTLIQ